MITIDCCPVQSVPVKPHLDSFREVQSQRMPMIDMPVIRQYFASLFDHRFMPTAFKVALVVGSLLFLINHGWALLHGQMTPVRWASGGLTYFVPYMVNIHGQYISQSRMKESASRLPQRLF